jgi:hypothetical protein
MPVSLPKTARAPPMLNGRGGNNVVKTTQRTSSKDDEASTEELSLRPRGRRSTHPKIASYTFKVYHASQKHCRRAVQGQNTTALPHAAPVRMDSMVAFPLRTKAPRRGQAREDEHSGLGPLSTFRGQGATAWGTTAPSHARCFVLSPRWNPFSVNETKMIKCV